MKKLAILFFAVLAFAACKKTTTPIDNSVPLVERIPGNWDITEINYSGLLPNPINPGQFIPFSGIGQNLVGDFNFTSDPNYGEFNVSFLASVDIGTSQPLTAPVSQSHYGEWNVNPTNDTVNMWRNDSTYQWAVLKNLPDEQRWSTQFDLYFVELSDTLPVNVEVNMKRK
jgi:hypothetical protein